VKSLHAKKIIKLEKREYYLRASIGLCNVEIRSDV
jgi:hypothetical protein